MKIAIPIKDGVIFSHFGGASSFYFATVDSQSKRVLGELILDAPEHVPGAFPMFICQNKADVVIAQGMGASAKEMLAASGVEVITGAPSDKPSALVDLYISGNLASRDVECSHDHHHGGH
jgi:predicted Fe-Mo cluster-binding NifX family protein